MSMRTTLSGCSLARIRQTFGSADEELIDAIRARVNEEAEEYDDREEGGNDAHGGEGEDEQPSQGGRMQEALAAIVAKLRGRAAAPVQDEGHAGYLAATALLRHVDGDDRPFTNFEVKNFFWLDLLETHAAVLGDDAALFEYLAVGRPFFGEAINNECTYAWFEKDEAIRLRDAARRVAAAPGVDDEVVEILTGEDEGLAPCIDEILAAGYDVWAETT